MPALSSLFLTLALILAVTIGPQTRAWSWGPAMLALATSVIVAIPILLRRPRSPGNFGTTALGILTVAWFAWRAWISPVAELGLADLMLLAGAVGSFVVVRAIEGNNAAEKILSWGVTLLLVANIVAIGIQVKDPSFSPIFGSRASIFPSGFYGHYNEAANYLIASFLFVGASAIFGKHLTAVRILWLLIALAGFGAVFLTKSRGGMLGACIGAGVLMTLGLVIAHRKKARWFGPAVIGVPLIAIIVVAALFTGWKSSQEARGAATDVASVMDNNSRLYLLGVAMSCVGSHPVAGGGSRSFSWESYRFFEGKLQGDAITRKPEQVHNEFIQAFTDYGITGGGLLGILLAALAITCVIRILFYDTSGSPSSPSSDVWKVGGLAAFAGMFVQSNFSFVFHLLPGVILLGIALGQLSRTSAEPSPSAKAAGSRYLLIFAAVASLALLIPLGWRGSRVTAALWPMYLAKVPLSTAEAKVDALSEAIAIWPTAAFYQERASIHHLVASESTGAQARDAAENAISDYMEAADLHPFDPGIPINRANLLSELRRDKEAEDAYDLAIHLQGGMEPAFRARFSLASHLMKKAARAFSPESPENALAILENAAVQIEQTAKEMHWITPDLRSTRVTIHESLGAAREANGNYDGAMEAYDFVCSLPTGEKGHYRAAILNGKIAAAAWNARNSPLAMAYFIEARRRLSATSETTLPEGVSMVNRAEYLKYLNDTINFMTGAKIQPATLPKK